MNHFTGKERREYVRISVELPVTLHFGDQCIASPAVLARDMSTCGLGIMIERKDLGPYKALLEIEGPIEVEFEIPGSGRLRIPAELAWCDLAGKGDEQRLCAGLRFLNTGGPEEDLLKRFVRSRVFDYAFPSRSDGERDK